MWCRSTWRSPAPSPRPADRVPTSTGRALTALVAVVAAVVTAGCSGSDDSTTSTPASDVATGAGATTTPTAMTAGTATSVATAGGSVVVVPAPTDTGDLPPVGTGDLPPVGTGDVPPVTSDLPYPISVTVGIDADPERIETVPAGATVTITVINPSAADEFHLHGYDLGDAQMIPAGQPATFTFVANQTGSFELESHETGDVLMILEVV